MDYPPAYNGCLLNGSIATLGVRGLGDRSPRRVHVANATRHFSYPCNFSVSNPVSPVTNIYEQAQRDQARRRAPNVGGSSRRLAMLQEAGVGIGPNRSLGTIASVAYKKGIMGEATFQAVLGLRVMRNLAVHGGEEDLDAARAMEFLSLAEAVLYSLDVRPE